MREWSAHAAGNPNDLCRRAEHAVAADRFAREIVPFLKMSHGARAAAERQTVGPPLCPSMLQLLFGTPRTLVLFVC
jgi:hypothetical protein